MSKTAFFTLKLARYVSRSSGLSGWGSTSTILVKCDILWNQRWHLCLMEIETEENGSVIEMKQNQHPGETWLMGPQYQVNSAWQFQQGPFSLTKLDVCKLNLSANSVACRIQCKIATRKCMRPRSYKLTGTEKIETVSIENLLCQALVLGDVDGF